MQLTDQVGRVPLPPFIERCLQVTGVPVVKSEGDKTLVGVLSKKDLSKPGKLVKDVYSSPPVAAKPENKVADAACLMLKHKVCNGHFISRLRPHSYVLAVMQTFHQDMQSCTHWWGILTRGHPLGTPSAEAGTC